MDNRTVRKISFGAIVIALVLVILLTSVIFPHGEATIYDASYIERLDNADGFDYRDFLNSSVMYELPDTIKGTQEISVIISFDSEDLMEAYDKTDKSASFAQFVNESEKAVAVREKIAEEKAAFLSKLDELGVEYKTGDDYTTILAGFEILIKASDFAVTAKSLKNGTAIVGEVYNVAETQLVENEVNVYGTGIFNSSDVVYDGSGMVVAVLDTGLDYSHSAFSTDNFTSKTLGLTYSDVAALVDNTVAATLAAGLTVDDVYINEKVPYGFDYADADPDVYSTHNNHGTHVSGVITGKDDTITGVAPNAQLVSMKIFSDVMDTARTSWILSALEDCVVLGVDVINMSIGTACGFSRETDEEAVNGVYDKIRAAGISMVVAASNSYNSAYGSEANGNLGLTSNPDTGTVGSPSTYDGTLSVASINGTETPYLTYNGSIIYFSESTNGATKENEFVKTLLGDKESLEVEFVKVPGVGRSADYTGLDVKGKIALVRRGDTTFEEKAMIAEAQGAMGIIIYNNVSGDIKMNVGDAVIAVCSISQDDGEVLAAAGSGTIVLSSSQTSGPFMSDFSSWGPAPDLGIKPEITAHGGNILSSVTGGGYDRLSGTSMACPNLSGVVTLLRQYVVEKFPEIADDNVAVAAMVNRLMMSTADIIYNTNGLPYAVRKQGAGLANLKSSVETPAYIITYDNDGGVMDKTKLELGDDPEKTGVYTLNFTVVNFSDETLTYDLSTHVFTEGVSETKTSHGETTVTEEAYVLGGATTVLTTSDSDGGGIKDNTVTVLAGGELDLTVTITLSDEDKAYLDTSFENGMYVEGFVTLTNHDENGVDLSVPYLAFYGDWSVAPLFDLDYYETNADELDDSIAIEDKTMPDAYATRPIGGISEDYISYLGSYYFLQDPDDIVISASRDYIALSNQEGTVHSLRFVWAGLLRNAAKIEITITDDATGEVVYECVDEDVRKSYGDGGSIYPANIEIEFDTMDYNLNNNTRYTVTLVGYLDYEDGGVQTNEKNVFTFPLTIDFEAPTVSDVEFYYEYDKTLEKNRLYAKVAVFDNHYAMSMQLGYVGMNTDEDGNATPVLMSFEQFPTPVYSERNSTTYVTFELTDYIYDMKELAITPSSFVLTCYDYAINYATYEIGLPVDYIDFCFENMSEGLTLSPNEVFTIEPIVYPDTKWAELLEFSSSKTSVARIVNNKIVAVGPGNAIVKVRDPETNKSTSFVVTVLSEGDEGYQNFDKPVADVFRLTGYETIKAYYVVDNTEQDIGETNDIRFFEGDYSLALYPSETVNLRYDLDAYFPNDTEVVFESSNENIVRVDDLGNVTGEAEGFASVTVKLLLDGVSTYYSESVTVEVKDPYITTGASLTHYYGRGGVVTIPETLDLTEIGSFAFSNFEYIAKTEEELAFDDAETSKAWFIGDNTVTKVIIPEGVEKINSYAFANLTALEEVVLPSTLEAIEYGAFYNCVSLQKISFSSENNLKIINQNAFELCNLTGTLDLSSVCVISDYAFAGNKNLKKLILPETLQSVGQYAFAACESLSEVTIAAAKVKYGQYAFTGCESLESFTVNSAVIPTGMFYECESLENITVGADVNSIGEFAFKDTDISEYTVASGNKAYKNGTDECIVSTDGKTLVAVPATLRGEFSLDDAKITTVGRGAFSHSSKVTKVSMPNVTTVQPYAFASAERLAEVTLGTLDKIGEYAFFETAVTELPKFTSKTEIGRYAFSYTDIKTVTIPDGMNIPEGVFSECTSLHTVVIGDGVVLGKYAFNVSKHESMYVVSYEEGDNVYCKYEFSTALTSLTIGDNVTIGENAFTNAGKLESVTLGDGAVIEYMAFYNNSSLKYIDLSKVKSIKDYAFSGDVYYVCLDEGMEYPEVTADGYYVYTYHAPLFESIDLSGAESIGAYAFAYCRNLTEVNLGTIIKIPEYAFAGTVALRTIDLSDVTEIGAYAFVESALTEINLKSARTIGEYAFVYCYDLMTVILSRDGTDIDEGAFAYTSSLEYIENLNNTENIGAYAFAHSSIRSADVSGAVVIDDFAFLKEELTPFDVTLGDKLTTLGDNPFAMCDVMPFGKIEVETFNGVDYEKTVYTYNISDTVYVIDGSLYCRVPNGLELITYAGINPKDEHVADDTVRISSMAFAGSNVAMVTLPYTVESVGHKAFYDCDGLQIVVFTSYYAPVLEEEFDSAYYESFEHIPGSGSFGTYEDYDGNEVEIFGINLIPYYMWNATDMMYSNVFYGANFVDYVGYVRDKLVMVRPANGVGYETFITAQYFSVTVDGDIAADDVTLAAIAAINAIPERVSLEDEQLVIDARTAYDKIATTEQQACVTNYAVLVSAEQRIIALKSAAETPDDGGDGGDTIPKPSTLSIIIGAVSGAVIIAAGAVGIVLSGKKKNGADADDEASTDDATDDATDDTTDDTSDDADDTANADE